MEDLRALIWRKSTRSTNNGGHCVELARLEAAQVAVRDSKDPSGPVLIFSSKALRTLKPSI